MVVDCDMRKWVDRPHWRFAARLLGTDEFGTWFATPPGTAYTGPRGAGEWPHGFAMLVPDDGWWIASFNDEGDPNTEVYVDITTVAHWPEPARISAIDLDLDVIRRRDGTVFIDDEDEFEDHRVRFGYPPHVVEKARETAQAIFEAVEQRREPFGIAYHRWLASVQHA